MFDIFKFRFLLWLKHNRIKVWWKRNEERQILRIMARQRLEEHRYKERFMNDIHNAFDGLERILPCDYGVDKRDYHHTLWCHSVVLQLADDIRSGKIVISDSEKKSSAKGTE